MRLKLHTQLADMYRSTVCDWQVFPRFVSLGPHVGLDLSAPGTIPLAAAEAAARAHHNDDYVRRLRELEDIVEAMRIQAGLRDQADEIEYMENR